MEQKVLKILEELNEDIPAYEGDNLFDAGLLDSLQAVDLVGELEDAFDIEIDAKDVVEDNFKSKDVIIALVKRLLEDS
ncbi:MAG: acyl carrier protein [Lachnospiraceae bacterium]|jgi:acyl carrier protein|nr:acyl carrier protein [Lachnospiraceae bacterium]